MNLTDELIDKLRKPMDWPYTTEKRCDVSEWLLNNGSEIADKLIFYVTNMKDMLDTAEAMYQAVPEAWRRGKLPENGNRQPSEMIREVFEELVAERDRYKEIAESR